MLAETRIRHKKLTKNQILRKCLLVPTGAAMEAIALETFFVPNHIIDGGITGISIIFSELTGISLGLYLFFLNLPFFFIGYKQMGKTFVITTVSSITILSVFTTLFESIPEFTSDPLLGAVFGGIILGIGAGLVIRNGGTSDGTEILAILFNKGVPFSVGETIMFFNIFILGSAGFVFGWDHAMYSLIAYFIAFKMIDTTVEGLESSRSVWIISDQHEEIGDALNTRLGRGITYLEGEGGYTGEEKKMIFCVITRLEMAKLKDIVEEFDPSAFLAVADVHDVKGERFKKKNIH